MARTCCCFVLFPFSRISTISSNLIKHEGITADSVTQDLAIPMVATRDVAEVAVRALKARDWKGVVVRELLGQRDLSYAEATHSSDSRLESRICICSALTRRRHGQFTGAGGPT